MTDAEIRKEARELATTVDSKGHEWFSPDQEKRIRNVLTSRQRRIEELGAIITSLEEKVRELQKEISTDTVIHYGPDLEKIAALEKDMEILRQEVMRRLIQVSELRQERERCREVLEDIANMPEHDQDDDHRLRHKAKAALQPAGPGKLNEGGAHEA